MSTRTTIRAASSVGGILCARPSSARRRSGRERNAWRDCACCRNCRRREPCCHVSRLLCTAVRNRRASPLAQERRDEAELRDMLQHGTPPAAPDLWVSRRAPVRPRAALSRHSHAIAGTRVTYRPRKLKISKVKRSMTTCSRTSCCFSGDRPRSRRLPSSRSSSAGRRAAARNARTISSKSSGASHARASPSLDLTPPVPAQRPAVGEGPGIHVRALGARP